MIDIIKYYNRKKSSIKDPFVENIALSQKILNYCLDLDDYQLNNLALNCYEEFINNNDDVTNK